MLAHPHLGHGPKGRVPFSGWSKKRRRRKTLPTASTERMPSSHVARFGPNQSLPTLAIRGMLRSKKLTFAEVHSKVLSAEGLTWWSVRVCSSTSSLECVGECRIRKRESFGLGQPAYSRGGLCQDSCNDILP